MKIRVLYRKLTTHTSAHVVVPESVGCSGNSVSYFTVFPTVQLIKSKEEVLH